jgi:hypothetical protein
MRVEPKLCGPIEGREDEEGYVPRLDGRFAADAAVFC